MEEKIKENNQRLKNIARWIAVIPAALAGILVGTIAINIFSLIQRWWLGASGDGAWASFTIFIFAPAVGAALAVYWGVTVAPKAKKVVSMIIGALVIILHTVNVVMAFSFQNPDAWWMFVGGIASIIAAGYVVYYFFTKENDNKLFI